jgi:hypothetical protein
MPKWSFVAMGQVGLTGQTGAAAQRGRGQPRAPPEKPRSDHERQ